MASQRKEDMLKLQMAAYEDRVLALSKLVKVLTEGAYFQLSTVEARNSAILASWDSLQAIAARRRAHLAELCQLYKAYSDLDLAVCPFPLHPPNPSFPELCRDAFFWIPFLRAGPWP